jgi:hypothetical protein
MPIGFLPVTDAADLALLRAGEVMAHGAGMDIPGGSARMGPGLPPPVFKRWRTPSPWRCPAGKAQLRASKFSPIRIIRQSGPEKTPGPSDFHNDCWRCALCDRALSR